MQRQLLITLLVWQLLCMQGLLRCYESLEFFVRDALGEESHSVRPLHWLPQSKSL